MDIFTDASLNQRRRIAGISAIFVFPFSNEITVRNSHFSTDNIEIAELLAIAASLRSVAHFKSSFIRVVSDSVGAIRKIQRIFQYPNQHQIHTLKDETQKKILYNISDSFSKMRNISFLFHHIRGHQRKQPEYTDGYYNMLADREAESGRLRGEFLNPQRTGASRICVLSEEDQVIASQMECLIVSPQQIKFRYDMSSPVVKSALRISSKRGKYYHFKHLSARVRR